MAEEKKLRRVDKQQHGNLTDVIFERARREMVSAS